MQQTDKYKLNLIEGGDDFSPEPLNQNARAVEEALEGHETRIVSVEAHKIAVGTYRGNSGTQTIRVGFTPVVVIIRSKGTFIHDTAMAVTGVPMGDSDPLVSIVDGGFTVRYSASNDMTNYEIADYIYFAMS